MYGSTRCMRCSVAHPRIACRVRVGGRACRYERRPAATVMPPAAAPRRGRRQARIEPGALAQAIRENRTIKAAAVQLGIGQRTLQAHLARRPELRSAAKAARRCPVHAEPAGTKIDQDIQAGRWPAVRLRLQRNAWCWQQWCCRRQATAEPAQAPTGRRRGRPAANIQPPEVEALIRAGLTIKAAAAAIGVGQRTLQKQLAARPELRAAEIAGRRRSVHLEAAERELDRLCAEGYRPALRFRMLRSVGWLQAGFGVRQVSPRLGLALLAQYERNASAG